MIAVEDIFYTGEAVLYRHEQTVNDIMALQRLKFDILKSTVRMGVNKIFDALDAEEIRSYTEDVI